MITITKDEYNYLRQRIKHPYVTICSKRKRGTKGSRMSGKTYYCPENNSYLSIINEYRERFFVESGEAND